MIVLVDEDRRGVGKAVRGDVRLGWGRGGGRYEGGIYPPILPTTIKRLLSPNVYDYGAVITFPESRRASRRWTLPRLTLRPALYTLYVQLTALQPSDVYYDDLYAAAPAQFISALVKLIFTGFRAPEIAHDPRINYIKT